MSSIKSDNNPKKDKGSNTKDEDIEKAKRFSILQHNPWNVYLGDCAVVTSYLKDKPLISLAWSPIHVINIFLRAVGQVTMLSVFNSINEHYSASICEQPPAWSHHPGWTVSIRGQGSIFCSRINVEAENR